MIENFVVYCLMFKVVDNKLVYYVMFIGCVVYVGIVFYIFVFV